jgi:DNA repair protein RadC
MTLCNILPPGQRPRERLLRHGAAALTSAELLALMIGTGTRGQNALALAEHLLEHFGGVRPLLAARTEELRGIHGLGDAKICQLVAILALAKRALEEELRRECTLQVPDQVKAYCAALLGHEPIEYCMALFLDNQYRLICSEEISRGTLTQTSIYPREVVKAGLTHHAAAIILAHNHPSGLAEPSAADIHLTRQLKQSLAMVDITLLDHLIVAANKVVSLAELGHI